ncbi:unnamed protein product [Kuraishia capsulata CBS 1993]|uniref:Mitochondrial import inner membrane translocase subunit n=1 Tax=Kuraishia capsulata CBS 1993 TaxID=1382522 RepID=W6MF64_9ASCO|nr:uncharacterized protein KUCA_T00000289001 [Kuraishia capsulata CBS 1993]CDK24329.1 unnamed protein product [Kuraishia capsulata CBS 1993]
MSFFGLGSSPSLSSEAKIKAAESELDMVTTMFNQLVDSCHKKCFEKSYVDGELTKTETTCIDRCVAKYFEANVKVGEVSDTEICSKFRKITNVYFRACNLLVRTVRWEADFRSDPRPPMLPHLNLSI